MNCSQQSHHMFPLKKSQTNLTQGLGWRETKIELREDARQQHICQVKRNIVKCLAKKRNEQ